MGAVNTIQLQLKLSISVNAFYKDEEKRCLGKVNVLVWASCSVHVPMTFYSLAQALT